jgi:hypothetical protein
MPEKPIIWRAYCITCQKDVYDRAANGIFVQAAGERHLRENPCHQVILGFSLSLPGQVSPEIMRMATGI